MSDASSKPFSASIDMAEIDRYAALAHTWWDPRGPFWPLHRLNALRTQYLKTALARALKRDANSPLPLRGLTVLDVGCGGGLLAEAMAALGARVHGIDVVEGNVRTARFHARSQPWPLTYEVTTAEALAATRQRYDIVLTMEVVEHVADLGSFLDACANLVNPGGIMSVATINRTWRSWLFAIIGAENILQWLPRGTHQWQRFVKPAELERILRGNDFTIFDECGVRINPLTRRFSTTGNLAVNYMTLARREA